MPEARLSRFQTTNPAQFRHSSSPADFGSEAKKHPKNAANTQNKAQDRSGTYTKEQRIENRHFMVAKGR